MIIETEKLTLRPFLETDASDVLEYLHHPEVKIGLLPRNGRTVKIGTGRLVRQSQHERPHFESGIFSEPSSHIRLIDFLLLW